MPTVREILGYDTQDRSIQVTASRLAYRCPFSGRECTAGNRNVTVDVRFPDRVERKRAGICTISAAGGDWMVCPNRLFALDSVNPTDLRSWDSLSDTVRFVLRALGATPELAGYPLGAWREISISERRGAKSFSYRFDFIINPVADMTAEEFAADWNADVHAAQHQFGEVRTLFVPKRVPGYPLVVEVMTASTSGSNERQARGIAPSFYGAWESAMNGGPIQDNAPGPNIRQVWGRMASQLIAKSEAGEYWGGKTVWIMQDLLLQYIHDTTHISTSQNADDANLPLPLRSANIVSFKFGGNANPGETRNLEIDRFIGDDIPNMYDALGHATMHGILHAPFVPEPSALATKLLQGQQAQPTKLEVIILP